MRRMDIEDFLRARIDDDEATARNVLSGYAPGRSASWSSPWSGGLDTGDTVTSIDNDGPIAHHVAAWDPARVLAEAKTKRRLIDLASEANGLDIQVENEFGVGRRDEETDPYCGDEILREMARPYAGHPDYNEAWRPRGCDASGVKQ